MLRVSGYHLSFPEEEKVKFRVNGLLGEGLDILRVNQF